MLFMKEEGFVVNDSAPLGFRQVAQSMLRWTRPTLALREHTYPLRLVSASRHFATNLQRNIAV